MEPIELKNSGIGNQDLTGHDPGDPNKRDLPESQGMGELHSLLGGLVSPLLRDDKGDLDLSKIPRKDFEEFRQFLITQVKNDGIAFNEHLLASYHKVLAKEEYRPLLEGLFASTATHDDPLLKRFTAEIISVSAQKFVSNNIQSDGGRQRIRSILFNSEAYTKEIRADVAKAVAQNGYEMGTLTSTYLDFKSEIGILNYANLVISDEKMTRGTELANTILKQVEEISGQAQSLQEKYASQAKDVVRFRGLRKIGDEEIQAKAKLADRGAKSSSAVDQLTGKLAQFWLMVVDEGHWQQSNAYKTAANGAFLLKETERLLQERERIGTKEAFLEWSEQVRDFLTGGLHVTGKGLTRDLADFFAPSTVKDMMGSIPQALRSPYDNLKQFVDEIHFSADMGDRILLVGDMGKDKLTEVRSKFLQGLQQAKRSLWYGYKQHRALSRGLSYAASFAGWGDIAGIKKGEQALDEIIEKVELARDPREIQAAVEQLQKELGEEGRIQGAMRDAEMEGFEQIIGLGQSILILLASRGLLQLAGKLAPALQATQVAAEETLALRASKAFGLGAYLSGAENAVAATSGEVRPDGEYLSNWLKDSLATGISMMATAPLASFLGKQHPTTPSVTDRIITRYFRSGIAGLGHFAADAAAETVEEYIDATVRAKLDDSHSEIGWDQAREIAMVTMAGGGIGSAIKMGTLGEILKGPHGVEPKNNDPPPVPFQKNNPAPPPTHLVPLMKPVVETQIQESPTPAEELKPEETIEPYPMETVVELPPESKGPTSFKVEMDELDQQYLQGLEKRDYVKALLEHPVLHPTTKVQTGNYLFFFSPVVQETQEITGEKRLHALAVVPVEKDGKISLKRRWFYKSQSGGNWRSSPYKSWGHYIKGVGIHYTAETQPTQEIHRHLNYLEKGAQTFPEISGKDLDQFVDVASPMISEGSKKTMIAGFGEEIRNKSVLGMTDIQRHKPGHLGVLVDHPYRAEFEPSMPQTLWNFIYPEGFVPDFTQAPLRIMEDTHSLLGSIQLREHGGSVLQEKSGDQKVRQVRWTVAEDAQGRVWIQSIRFADAQPNSYGVYEDVIDSGVLTSKPLEYHQQVYGIEQKYRKSFNGQYADITPLLSLLMPIRKYRQARGLPVQFLSPLGFSQGFIQNGNQYHFFVNPKTIYLVLGKNYRGNLAELFQHPSVEAEHAKITSGFKPGAAIIAGAPRKYFIEDLGSANGTIVNGTRLKPKTRHPIKAGDKIWLGAVNFIFGGTDPAPLLGGVNQNLALLLAGGLLEEGARNLTDVLHSSSLTQNLAMLADGSSNWLHLLGLASLGILASLTLPKKAKATRDTHSSNPFSAQLRERAATLPDAIVAEVREVLEKEWGQWGGKESISKETQTKIEGIFQYYARYALALLGRETPKHLNFIGEVFAVALQDYLNANKNLGREIDWTDGDRIHLNRFLSTQLGRKDAGIGHQGPIATPLSLPGASFASTRSMLQEKYALWELFLRVEMEKLQGSPLEKAQLYQRCRNLMHFYGSYLYGRFGEGFNPDNPEMIYQRDLLQQTLQDASKHPYPREAMELFDQFFREELKINIPKSLESDRPDSVHPADLSLQPLEISPLNYSAPRIGERWDSYLASFGYNRKTLLPADWGLAGATVFSWGTQRDTEGRLKPPGEILQLLGVLSFLNAENDDAMDPFDVARLTMPDQLSLLAPDEEGRIVIRYPDLMTGVDYAHFGLGHLLQAYLRNIPEAHDMDLANQWGVSEQTVKRYREGTSSKLRISKLDPLVDSLVPSDPQNEARYKTQRAQMLQLLTFLRYRAYFDSTMSIEDEDGNPLNRTPADRSQYRIVLVPQHTQLRPLDITRRIRFEREPFASAINGTVDLALKLIEDRKGEFEMLGYSALELPEGALTLQGLQDKVRDFRDQHGLYFQLLSQHERSPGVVHPGQLRQIQEFYRSLFKFFEAIHLHTRPEGQLKVGDMVVSFEIVPQTTEQPYGIRIRPNPKDPHQQRAYVVATDLLENAKDKSHGERGEFIKMRVMAAFLKRLNLLIDGQAFDWDNRVLLKSFLEANGIQVTEKKLDEFFRLERWANPENMKLDYTTEAILHRITRGHLEHASRERRVRHWEQDIQAYVLRHRLTDSLARQLGEAFHGYLQRVSEPFQGFSEEQLHAALEPILFQKGEAFAREVEGHLRNFMKGVGLPVDNQQGGPAPSFSIQGLAQVSLASYLNRFTTIHPLRATGQMIVDRELMARVIDDRLVDFPQLTPHRALIMEALEKLIETYNLRKPLLKVLEVTDEDLARRQSWNPTLLSLVYDRLLEEAKSKDPSILGKIKPQLMFAAIKELSPQLAEGNLPGLGEVDVALLGAFTKFSELGLGVREEDLEIQQKFLHRLTQDLYRRIRSLDRLSELLPRFVQQRQFHSGLEDTQHVGAMSQEIFKRFFHSAFLDADPTPLRENILDVVGRRFDPYSAIREDVVRGMAIIFFNSLEHIRNEYDQFGSALEISAAEAETHGDENVFWQSFITLVSSGDSKIQSREDVERRIADFENFLLLFPYAPTGNFAERLRAVLEKLRRRPDPGSNSGTEPETGPDPQPEPTPQGVKESISLESVLAVPVPAEFMEKFSELEIVDKESLRQAIEKYGDEIPLLVKPEGRALLQLVTFWGIFQEFFTPEQKKGIEELILEIQTAPNTQSSTNLTEQIFSQYQGIRHQIESQIPPLERVRYLSRLREEGELISPVAMGMTLVKFLVGKKLSPRLEKIFWETCLDLQAAIFARKGENPELLGDLLFLPFYNRLASLYLENQEEIHELPPFEFTSTDGKPLKPENIPQELKDRLEREAPEVFSMNEPAYEDYLLDPLYVQKNQGRPPIAEGYILERIFILVFNPSFSSLPSKQKFMDLYSLRTLLSTQGLDQPLIAARLTDQILKLFHNRRHEIQKILINKIGIENLVSSFPEIARQEVKPLMIQTEQGEVQVNPLEGNDGKLLNALIRLPLPPEQRRALDKFLWDIPEQFSPKNTTTQQYHQFQNNLIKRWARYYLQARNELLEFSDQVEGNWNPAPRKTAEEWQMELWETAGLTPEYYKILTEVFPENHRKAISLWQPEKEQWLLSFPLGGENLPMELPGAALLSVEQMKKLSQQGSTGESFQLNVPGKKEILPDEEISRTKLHPLVFQQLILLSRMHWPILFIQRAFKWDQAVGREAMEIVGSSNTLLSLHADPDWVLGNYENRLFELYHRHRERILTGLDFASGVQTLPEVAGVPLHALGKIAKEGFKNLALVDYPATELIYRLGVMFENIPEGKKELLGSLPAKKIAFQTPAQAANEVSQHYLRIRAQILPLLGPWPEAPAYDEVWQEVAHYPEILSVSEKEIQAGSDSLGMRYRPHEDDLTLAEVVNGISVRLRELDQLGHSEFRAGLRDFLTSRIGPNHAPDAQYDLLVQWYKEHREEIMARLRTEPLPIGNAAEVIGNFYEIKTLLPVMLKTMLDQAIAGGHADLLGIKEALRKDELFLRIYCLVVKNGSSDLVKRKFWSGLVKLRGKKSQIDGPAARNFAVQFYQKYRAMILNPSLAAPDDPLVEEVVKYGELRNTPRELMMYDDSIHTHPAADLGSRIEVLLNQSNRIPEAFKQLRMKWAWESLQDDDNSEIKLAQFYKTQRLKIISALTKDPRAEGIQHFFNKIIKDAEEAPELQDLDPQELEAVEREVLERLKPEQPATKGSDPTFTTLVKLMAFIHRTSIPQELQDEFTELFDSFHSEPGCPLAATTYLIADWYFRHRRALNGLDDTQNLKEYLDSLQNKIIKQTSGLLNLTKRALVDENEEDVVKKVKELSEIKGVSQAEIKKYSKVHSAHPSDLEAIDVYVRIVLIIRMSSPEVAAQNEKALLQNLEKHLGHRVSLEKAEIFNQLAAEFYLKYRHHIIMGQKIPLTPEPKDPN